MYLLKVLIIINDLLTNLYDIPRTCTKKKTVNFTLVTSSKPRVLIVTFQYSCINLRNTIFLEEYMFRQKLLSSSVLCKAVRLMGVIYIGTKTIDITNYYRIK